MGAEGVGSRRRTCHAAARPPAPHLPSAQAPPATRALRLDLVLEPILDCLADRDARVR